MALFACPKKSCRCCKVGRCCSCSCVRDGKTCQNCFPGLEGRCTNMTACLLLNTRRLGQSTVTTEADVDVSSPSGSCSDMSPSRLSCSSPTPPPATELTDIPLDEMPSWPDSQSLAVRPQSAIPHDLTEFSPMSEPTFLWNDIEGSFSVDIKSCYDEVVHWWRNIFKVLHSKVGICFVHELVRRLC